jgi:hypothetical protein
MSPAVVIRNVVLQRHIVYKTVFLIVTVYKVRGTDMPYNKRKKEKKNIYSKQQPNFNFNPNFNIIYILNIQHLIRFET